MIVNTLLLMDTLTTDVYNEQSKLNDVRTCLIYTVDMPFDIYEKCMNKPIHHFISH